MQDGMWKATAGSKLIVFAKRGTSSPTSHTLHKNLWEKLDAAYSLCDGYVTFYPDLQVGCHLLPELMLLRVISHGAIKKWGGVADVQELADTITTAFPLGVIMLHHRLQKAFYFQCEKTLQLMHIKQAPVFCVSKR